jgi:hypothetical protein
MKVLVFHEENQGGRLRWSHKIYETLGSVSSIEADNSDFLFADGQWYVRSQMGNSRRMHICDDPIPPEQVPKFLRLSALILT